jgi:HAD superfamily phosphoserine phosphatase-like hydrolase
VNKLWVFTDFDGTISEPDTIDLLGKLFDRPAERAVMKEKFLAGLMRPKEWLCWEIGLVNVPLKEALGLLRERVAIDPAFPLFAKWCRSHDIPLTILSNGLEEIIRSLLGPYDLGSFEIEANRLRAGCVPWKVIFRDDSPWGHDKSAYLKESRRNGYAPVYAGDGISDREAADCAEIIFAKGQLVEYCESVGLDHYRFTSFGDIQPVLHRLLPKGD